MKEEKFHPKQIEIYRKLSGEQRLNITFGLSQMVREISQFGKNNAYLQRKRTTSLRSPKTKRK